MSIVCSSILSPPTVAVHFIYQYRHQQYKHIELSIEAQVCNLDNRISLAVCAPLAKQIDFFSFSIDIYIETVQYREMTTS